MKLRERFRIDWPVVLGTLQKRGLSQRQIADRIGCSQALLSQLASGERRMAGYDIGAAALQLLAITTAGTERMDSHGEASKEICTQTASDCHSNHESSETHSRD
jgi:transcriptional regulator with XRE-family HTH domain